MSVRCGLDGPESFPTQPAFPPPPSPGADRVQRPRGYKLD